jgi:hypothetical protein
MSRIVTTFTSPGSTDRVFSPDRSQQNAHWILSSPLTDVRIVGFSVGYNRALDTVRHPPSPRSAAATTAALHIVTFRLYAQLSGQAEQYSLCMYVRYFFTC